MLLGDEALLLRLDVTGGSCITQESTWARYRGPVPFNFAKPQGEGGLDGCPHGVYSACKLRATTYLPTRYRPLAITPVMNVTVRTLLATYYGAIVGAQLYAHFSRWNTTSFCLAEY